MRTNMNITPTEITVRELVDQYHDSPFSGVSGYGGKLDIRPAYQREMVYTQEEEIAVIESILDGFPIGVMYWAVNGKQHRRDRFEYEVIDGQQRTISICDFVVMNGFAVRGRVFTKLSDEDKERILNYTITVYLCEGDNDAKMAWFERINIAGKALSQQELRNAVYTGEWLHDAKEYFREDGPAYEVCRKYLKFPATKKNENRPYDWRRWDGLELALIWACGSSKDKDIRDYMAKHQGDEDAEELFESFSKVFEWIEDTFPYQKGRERALRGNDWHEMYQQYKDEEYDPDELEREIADLMGNDEITQKHGIYWWVLEHSEANERKMVPRDFPRDIKERMYAEQGHRCPICHGNGEDKQYDLKDLQADHIVPWSHGGKTVIENCACLCSLHNNRKADKTVSYPLIYQWLDELRVMSGYKK